MDQERLNGFFPEKIRQAILDIHQVKSGKKHDTFFPALLEILSHPSWIDNGEMARVLKRPLTETAFFYLSQEKDRLGKPLNPVANFHLGNGATISLKNVNFGANRFDRGMLESCGFMVNYIYSSTWLQQIGRTMKAFLPWRS
jgi:malonyl-CoA decarboxylase